MADIEYAKSLVRRISFPQLNQAIGPDAGYRKRGPVYRDLMLHQGVMVNKSVTPSIHDLVSNVISRLNLTWDHCSFFINNSPDIQATCYTESLNVTIIQISSGLINLLASDELAFVVGHELGHFLGDHQRDHGDAMSPETIYLSRLSEIVADRVGFLATGNIESCLKAILKTASGLDERHLRFDFPSFLAQVKHLSENSNVEEAFSTHPSLLLRCRALLWFTILCPDYRHISQLSESQIADMNSRVTRDLDKYLNRTINQHKCAISFDLKTWVFALSIAERGVFDKKAQGIVAAKLGLKTLESLKSFFALHSKDEIVPAIESKLNTSLELLQRDFPNSSSEIIGAIKNETNDFH